ncbi:hypothetical protein DM02DRAFT_668684 [Periconia macrospinosa]|uniref:F-box domain-containing protein n=1 Tax=Periconia macrospinosa TaxID=97972 RepID=A0A2V1E4A3_9PLEO|nr:hypothetical protein DM02DRAFT_668684 [Periconia macrospinosa]
MPRHAVLHLSEDDEPLEDKTAALPLHSKRTDRQQKKQTKRARKLDAVVNLVQLPTELILECLKLLPPGDVLIFGAVNRRFRKLVALNANVIGDTIIRGRYPILAQCFPLPKLLSQVDATAREALMDERRQRMLAIHHKPYQHVRPLDPYLVCSCITCFMLWNNLCLALDFAHWQDNLDTGNPLPIIPRGKSPEWNEELVQRNVRIVRTALHNSLWHARILELHLTSTIRAIRRHAENKGNKRKHVEMSDEEAEMGTDTFLTKPGPLSIEFPFNRDEYYMLEAYLPNRWWVKTQDKWVYTIAGKHEQDIEYVVRSATRQHDSRNDSRYREK